MKKKLLVLTLLIGLVILSYLAYPPLKRRLTAPTVYQSAEAVEYVNNSPGGEVLAVSSRAILPESKWIPQTFNNCFPATTAMLLSHFGHNLSQEETKAALRTNPDDKNVFINEMADYIRPFGVESKLMYNGDLPTIKALIANGYYVVVEDWLHPNEDIGHVTIIRGFDDAQGVLIVDDSYVGVGIAYKYEVFDKSQWKPFNREYLVVYRPGQEEKARRIIGENWDEETMYKNSISRAQSEIANDPEDSYGYFNLGASYFALGDFTQAESAFEKSQSRGWPKRMLWYQIQPVQTANALGKYQQAIELADLGLWSNDSFSELHLEKAKSFKGLNDLTKAKAELETALKYSPALSEAREMLNSF